MKRLLLTVSTLAASIAVVGCSQYSVEAISDSEPSVRLAAADGEAEVERAQQNRASNVQVRGEGPVFKILKDDHEGSRHQRFLIRLRSGRTLLIAHNIDIAPRIPNIAEGDTVGYFGEYEWNDKGGVVHWTHRDPQRRHVDGWLKHRGKTYQ